MKKRNFNVTGKQRQKLAKAIAGITGSEAIYKNAPTYEYEIGDFILGRNGEVLCEDGNALDELITSLAEEGYTPAIEADADTGRESGIAIQMPMTGFDGDAISRLEQLVESKETLIKKSIGADSLMIGEQNGKLDFAWFKKDASPEEIHAYMSLVTALCKMAKEVKRITAKDRNVENEKYAFRCFLLRLGFIGDEYKADRKILLKNLDGNSAWRSGAPKEA